MSHDDSQNTSSAPAPSAHGSHVGHEPVGDDAATIIRAMEAKLAEVQRLTAESSRRAAELDAREVELVKTRLDIETQRRTIGEQRKEIEALRSRIAAEQQEHDQRLRGLEGELTESRRSIDHDRAAVQAERSEFEKRAAEIEKQGGELQAERQRIEQRAAEIEGVSRRSEEQAAEFHRRAAEIDHARGEIEAARASLDQKQQAFEQRTAEMAAAQAKLDQQRAELEERAHRLSDAEQIEAALKAQQATLKSAQEQLAERAAAVEAKAAALAQREAALAKLESETNELSRQAKERLDQAAEQLRAAEERAEHADEQVRLAEAKLSAAGQSAQQAVAARVELHEKLVAAESAQKQLSARALQLEEELRAARSAAGADAGAHSELQARFEALRADAERHGQRADAAERELNETRSKLQETLAQGAAQKKELEAAVKRLSGNKLAAEFEEVKKTLAAREETLRQVAQRLMAAEARLGERPPAEPRSEPAPSEVRSEPADWDQYERLMERVRVRQSRLKLYKQLLGAQSRKIMQAKTAMQRKAEQYDQVIAQRAKLSEAAASIELEKQRVQAKAARSGAALVTFCIFATVAIIGALGWAVASQVAPATYAARAVIVADPKGRELTRDEALAWTEGMEKLADDPALAQLAAERFAQRGMASLGTVGAVREHFKKNLTLMTDRPGELTMELRSQGSERASRELETFVIAATALANQQRDTRADGAGVLLKEPVKAGGEPLSDQRLIYVAGIGGAGSVAALLVGAVIFRFLARAKVKFEQDNARLAEF